ncbi:hypothetical protein CRE_05022 [Caenorhabditis remanei]|uniref:Uncharacterized protein n=1 Tax=Caenorhabditis remanei TaxID=31234 RepID=E3MZ28_CAERE|nr:hypothetical protein CRE_05022 [Caenorhabditis remanei]
MMRLFFVLEFLLPLPLYLNFQDSFKQKILHIVFKAYVALSFFLLCSVLLSIPILVRNWNISKGSQLVINPLQQCFQYQMVAVAVLKSVSFPIGVKSSFKLFQCHFWAAILFWNRPFLVPNYVIATTVLDFLSTPLFIQLSYLICYKKKFRNLKDNVSFGMILQGVIRTPKVQSEDFSNSSSLNKI